MKLVLSFRWHRDYHGRSRAGDPEPEWPPSPWRLFCALVSAARPGSAADLPACLRWLAAQKAPAIFTPPTADDPTPEPTHSIPLDDIYPHEPFREGRDSRGHLYKFRRDIRLPLLGARTIHYVWSPAAPVPAGHVEELDALMARVPYLGIAEDSGTGTAQLADAATLFPETSEWVPGAAAGIALATLDVRALEALVAFHHRGTPHGYRRRDVAPPHILYREKSEHPAVCTVFRFEESDGTLHSYECRDACAIAGRVRAAIFAAATRAGVSASFLHGHHEPGREHLHIAPLPSIGHEHADARVRRVLLHGTPPAAEAREVDLALRELAWSVVEAPHHLVLAPERTAAGVGRFYLATATEWATVTPIVLPKPELRGRESAQWHARHTAEPTARAALHRKLAQRRWQMIARLLAEAGHPPCELEVTPHPPHRHLPPAASFTIPPDRAGYLGRTRCHVRVCFARPVRGPLSLGPGRFFGLGLLAPARALQCATATADPLATLH
jgi:CRISPR-associated protein Csb2